jgi:hypothetical protein
MSHAPLVPCPKCGHPAEIISSIARGKVVAQCSEQLDCDAWPMTSPYSTEEEAAAAWNRGEFLEGTHPADTE